jgi:predicted MFS family arabinose efflux permease
LSAAGAAPASDGHPWGTSLALALAAAVSLGIARFSYGLLVPGMRADLGWSWATAGAMNTVNAAGYLLGALALPALLRRFDARAVMLAGGALAALALLLHGLVRSDAALYTLRVLAGLGSAGSFVGGGLLAARLAARQAERRLHHGGPSPGVVLAGYYGGTGLGIVASALLAPPFSWPHAWWALAVACALATALTAALTRSLHAPPVPGAPRVPVRWAPMGWMLAGYTMFGLGYIGYMTFIVGLLREQGLAAGVVTAFFVLLGLGCVASSWLWAGALQRWRGGQTLALLNGLLAVATLLPVLSKALPAVVLSGLLFGAVFLSVVASTTAFVRHNLPQAAWPAGIAAFTIVFAAGQVVGPTLVGLIADARGGLLAGLAVSAAVLALGSLLGSRQKPLAERVVAERDQPG